MKSSPIPLICILTSRMTFKIPILARDEMKAFLEENEVDAEFVIVRTGINNERKKLAMIKENNLKKLGCLP